MCPLSWDLGFFKLYSQGSKDVGKYSLAKTSPHDWNSFPAGIKLEQRNKGYAKLDQTTGLSSLVPCLWQWPILYTSEKSKNKAPFWECIPDT